MHKGRPNGANCLCTTCLSLLVDATRDKAKVNAWVSRSFSLNVNAAARKEAYLRVII